jgi:hypothetical protein
MTHESDWDVVVERASAPWVYVAGASLLGGLLGALSAGPGLTGPSVALGLFTSLVAALEGISIAGYRVRSTHGANSGGRNSLDIHLPQIAAIFLVASVLAFAEGWTAQALAPSTPLTVRFALLGAGIAGLASWWAWRSAFTVRQSG